MLSGEKSAQKRRQMRGRENERRRKGKKKTGKMSITLTQTLHSFQKDVSRAR